MSSLPDSSLAPSSAASETFAQSSSVNHGAAATPTTRSSSSNHHHHHHHHQGSGSSSNNNRARKNREEEVRVSQEGNEESAAAGRGTMLNPFAKEFVPPAAAAQTGLFLSYQASFFFGLLEGSRLRFHIPLCSFSGSERIYIYIYFLGFLQILH
jgi:hypothetical protein